MQTVGKLSDKIIQKLHLNNIEDRNIYLGESNIEHMKNDHPQDFLKYGAEIPNILDQPDYIRKNPKDDSIEYVKEYQTDNDFVKVAVRVSNGNRLYARTLYILNRRRVEDFIQRGTLIPYGTE